MIPTAEQIDALFAEWNKSSSPGCVLAIVQDGEIIYKRGYGMADLERKVPLSPASVFDLASTGKQFTAMLIVLLAEQGLLSLDDNIHKYIPEMPTYEGPITIRHLIHHTSGLRDYCELMELCGMFTENIYYEDELLDLICRQKELNFRPGEEYLYSNTGYFLLGMLARRVAGKPFTALLREYILEPLGMRATNFNDDPKRIVKNRAIGYSPKDEGGYHTEMSFCGGFGDGAILSSVEDLFLWDQNFYHNKLGRGGEELIQTMRTPGELNSGEKLEYAFGLEVSDYHGLRKVEHGGALAGYKSNLIRFPDQRFSVICLANLNSISPTRLALQVADLYLADQFTDQGEPSSPSEAEFTELSPGQIEGMPGFYCNQKHGNILKLSIEEGKLSGEIYGERFVMAAPSPTHLAAIETRFDLQIDFEESIPDSPQIIRVRIDEDKSECYQKMAVVPVTSAQLADYTGAYHSDELNITYKVLLDGEQLFLKRGYSPQDNLNPVTQDIFTSRYVDFRFERDERNQVCGFRLGAGRVRNIRFRKH